MREYSYHASVDTVSPAGQVMREALDLAIEERSPYPDRSIFLDADVPLTVRRPEMERAAKEGLSVVLVSSDMNARVFSPEEILDSDAGPA